MDTPVCASGEVWTPSVCDSVSVDTGEDEEAGELGAPSSFTEPEHEEEWMDWVNWSAVDAQTGGAGGSS